MMESIFGFVKVWTLSFSSVTLSSVALALFFSFRSTNPRIPQETIERYVDAMFRCIFAAQATLIAAVIGAILWLTFDVLFYVGWF